MTAGALFDISLGDRPRRELALGAVHVPSWLTSGQQEWIAGQFREWASGPVPARAAKVRGHEMSVRNGVPGPVLPAYVPRKHGQALAQVVRNAAGGTSGIVGRLPRPAGADNPPGRNA
jgi:hypothetical protein